MAEHITTQYDDEINAFIVLMPEHITLIELHRWQKEFLTSLRGQVKEAALLIDTNAHQFESIECLNVLRHLLSHASDLKNGITKAAFVQPRQYRLPEIVSSKEAYFSHFEKAHSWLRQNVADTES